MRSWSLSRLLPEERVRHFWVEQMVLHYGFPRELLIIEKELAHLPHLPFSSKEMPKRRLDLLVYKKREGQLVPLLLVECKAVALDEKHTTQLLGYNSFVNADYVALANQHHFVIANARELQFREGLPHYNNL